MSILQAENVITPFVSDWVQPDRAPGPPLVGVPAVIASVTVEASVVTVFPPASWTVTLGWVENALPPVAPEGGCEKASWAAAPTVMLKVPLVAPVRPLVAAVSV